MTDELFGNPGTTPILPGFTPDPSICRVGEDYFIANSSMEYSPAVPIWHSTDLTRWELIGNALCGEGQAPSGYVTGSRGIYAPTLRHHDGVFYLLTTNVYEKSSGQIVFVTEDPSGPWRKIADFETLTGIDPDIAWDSDGRCYLSYCAWDETTAGIKQAVVSLADGSVLEEAQWIWHGSGLSNPEGPHLFRRGKWWYLVIAEGGTERGHVISVARSISPRGPFEGAPHNPIFTHRSTSHLVQNVGHADLVECADGSWVAVYLGVRLMGQTPRYHANGRETFISAITWVDDWPVFTAFPDFVSRGERQISEIFGSGPRLNPRWVSPGIEPNKFVTIDGCGAHVTAVTSPSGEPSGLFTRLPDLYWNARVTIDCGNATGRFMLRLDSRHWYGLRFSDGRVDAISRVGDIESTVASYGLNDETSTFSISTSPSKRGGLDEVVMSVVTEGRNIELASLDGRYITTEVAGGFTGRLVGVVIDSGEACIRQIEIKAIDITWPMRG